MKLSVDFYRKIYPFSVVFVLGALLFVWLLTPRAESALILGARAEIPNYDIRADQSETARAAVEKFRSEAGKTSAELTAAQKESRRAEGDLQRAASGKLRIERSEHLQTPEIIAPDFGSGGAFLTAPSSQKRVTILKSYLKSNSALIGLSDAQIDALDVAADYTNPDGVLSFVVLEQKLNGIPVFGGEVSAGFTKHGALFRIINNLAPGLDEQSLSDDFGSGEESAARAVKFIDGAPLSGQTTTEKIYFPVETGVARAAWRVMLWTNEDAFYVITDARDGTLLWRKNLTARQTQAATYEVYGSATSMTKTGDSPSAYTPGCLAPAGCAQPPAVPRQSFTLIGNEPPYAFNNSGWIPDGENRTIGNNAEAGIDRDGAPGIDPNGWAFGSPNRNFVYVYNPAPGIPPPGEPPLPPTQTYPPSPFQQGSITNAFYAANRWHDETYLLGFTEAARNFQTDNFGRGGQGNDSLSIEVQDSSGSNGVTFSSGADSTRGRLNLLPWTFPTPDRDSALDNQIIMHELTHGLSTRLHGNGTGLSGNMARGMGEGWSDFYALALLSDPSDDPLGTHTVLGYLSYQISPAYESNYYYGIRRFPTALKASVGANGLPHNPLTFKYLNPGCDTLIGTTTTNPNSAFPRNPVISTSAGFQACDQIHNAGEIWSAMLWEVRQKLIERHGAVEGNRRVLQYATDGMKLSPFNPNMLQSRDAMLAAASASDAGDVMPIRQGFAIRGLGFYASILNPGTGNNNANVTESFEAAPKPARADFDGDGKSDLSVFRPSEGIWYVLHSGLGFGALQWGMNGDQLAPGDYDGDLKTDFMIFRPNADPAQPDFYVFRSSNWTYAAFSWGLPGDVPVIEDYDGDQRRDLAVYRPSNHTFYVFRSLDGNVMFYSGIPSGVPAAGDFDGDGKGDFATYSTSGWFLASSSANFATLSFTQWGMAGDIPVPADYDADGKDDFAVFRPSDRVWYIRQTTGTNAYVQFGLPNDIPVPADYDGDRKADVAIYRDGVWFIYQSSGGVGITQFGLSGDMPIANRYLP